MEATESTTPQLSESEVEKIEARTRTGHYPDLDTIRALCRDWRALQAERDEAREWLMVAKGNIAELQAENAALRDQLAEARQEAQRVSDYIQDQV